ncbi:MAG: CRISPR system precrRNA processing endoribonuclease RAMP protein Cas6 [Anaerolineae bacterium]
MIYTDSRPSMIVKRNNTVRFKDIERRAQTLTDDQVNLEFLTPTRIKHEGRFISQPPFHVIVRNVLRRVSSLYYFHCGEQWQFDYRGTIERAQAIRSAELDTRWVDWERYSGRQKARMKMGGFVGEAVYEGDLAEFRPLLLLGQLVHIGKACVFGNGRYEIR